MKKETMGQKGKRDRKRRKYTYLSLSVLAAQTMSYCPVPVSAEELQFSGSTEVSATEYYLDVDAFAAELEVEEVYAQSGSMISEGGQILKLTEESYQKAVDYYDAAVLRANDTLTDTQLEYDQGILEAKYTYELAAAKADQADFVREYQQQELEDTIGEHEDVLEDIEERIEELESGIADGSYDSGTGGSSGGGSARASGSGADNMTGAQEENNKKTEKEQESETPKVPESEKGQENMTEDEHLSDTSGAQTEPGDQEPSEMPSETQPGTEDQESSEMQSEMGEQEPSETQPGTEDQEPSETQPEMGDQEPSETDTEPGDQGPSETDSKTGEEPSETRPGGDTDGTAQKISELKVQIEEKTQICNTLLEKAIQMAGGDLTEEFSGEESEEISPASGENQSNLNEENLKEQLQSAISGENNVKENLENVQKNLDDVPDAVMSMVQAAYPDYEEYIALLSDCIAQVTDNIRVQQEILETLQESKDESADLSINSNSSVLTEISQILEELNQAGMERSELYHQLIELDEEQLKKPEEQIKAEGMETETDSSDGAENNQENSGNESGNDNIQETPGEENRGDREQEASENPEGTDKNRSPGGENGSGSQSTAGGTGGGSSMSSQGNMGGFSASGGTADAAGAVSFSESSQMNDEPKLSEDEISLFGSTYDLTQVKNLLEREPSDSEAAQEMIDQLEDYRKTVKVRYEELVRERSITELEIQYTYDTAVIAGKLAEITYAQELEEWEETLAEAKKNKTDMEQQQSNLAAIPEGIITAERSGTVASVSYEAGDIMTSMTPVISYYDTDVVTVTIAVPQEDIAKISVGDTVDVELSGYGAQTGTVSEKSLEAESGTSRTNVDYAVEISIENESGWLSAGVSAVVRIPDETKQGEEQAAVNTVESEEEKPAAMDGTESDNTETAEETEHE